jgi:hypothetical protein
MLKLIRYHTILANPDYYWENNEVAIKITTGQVKTYDEYVNACRYAGCVYYNEEVFNNYINNIS